VEDARRAFRRLQPRSYDAVVFGLLDSHTQLGMSSLRLDNYVFTLESFVSAAALLRPGGRLIVTAAIFRPWFGDRVRAMVVAACGGRIEERIFGAWASYRCLVDPDVPAGATGPGSALQSDDWPFLYLQRRARYPIHGSARQRPVPGLAGGDQAPRVQEPYDYERVMLAASSSLPQSWVSCRRHAARGDP
jgi:hypothetical protein